MPRNPPAMATPDRFNLTPSLAANFPATVKVTRQDAMEVDGETVPVKTEIELPVEKKFDE